MKNSLYNYYYSFHFEMDSQLFKRTDLTKVLDQKIVGTFALDESASVHIVVEEKGNHLFVDGNANSQHSNTEFIKNMYVVMPASKDNLYQIIFEYIPEYLMYVVNRYAGLEDSNDAY